MNEQRSMNDMVAIDFGTSRTKLAYFDPVTGRPQVHRLGRDDAIPSIFYVEIADGRIDYLVGERAANRFYRQPGNGFDKVKLRMSERLRLGRLRTTVLQVDLLRVLFQELRERAGREISVFAGPPKGVQLTQTDVYTLSERKTLREAAIEAGFDASRIETIFEPEAAAQLWLSETGSEIHDIIVLDFGGGTLDWTYLHREGDRYRTNAALPPGGEKVGGENIDDQLLAYVKSKLRSRGVQLDEEDVPRVRQDVRACKEQYCDGYLISEIEIDGEFIQLTGEEIQSAIESALITPACNVIKPYIKLVAEVTDREDPDVLLIGGSSKVTGLKERIESEFACKVFTWDRAEFAPVLGAALPDREADEDYVDQGVNHLSEEASEATEASAEEAQSLDPGSTVASPKVEKIERDYFEEGQKFLAEGKYLDAVDAFKEALKRSPSDPEIYLSMSRAHLELGYLIAAESSAKEVLRLDPNSQEAQEALTKVAAVYLSRGAIKMANEDYAGATVLFNKASAIDPQDEKVGCLRRGVEKMKISAYQSAVSEFKIALGIDPEDADIYTYIAMADLKLNYFPNAKACAQEALRLDPDSKLAKKVLVAAATSIAKQAPQAGRNRDSGSKEGNWGGVKKQGVATTTVDTADDVKVDTSEDAKANTSEDGGFWGCIGVLLLLSLGVVGAIFVIVQIAVWLGG